MKNLIPLAAVLFGLCQSQTQQYRYILEVSRHGSREPDKLFNFTKNPALNFNSTNNLTPFGRYQHYKLGEAIMKRYGENFLPKNYSVDDIWVDSTDRDRTYLSALYQLMGMYKDQVPGDAADIQKYNIGEVGDKDYLSPLQYNKILKKTANIQGLKVERVPGEEDYLMKVDEENCERYNILRKYASNSTEYALLQSFFTTNFKSRLEQVIKQKISSSSQMQKICAYIEWAQYQDLELTFSLNQQDYQYCMALVDSKQYASGYGLDELWKLSGNEFIRKLGQITSDFINNNNVKRPLFQHYAAHAETHTAIFEVLKVHWHVRSTPASAVFFEFIDLVEDKFNQQVETPIIQVLYHDGNTNSFELLKMRNGQQSMKLVDFQNYLKEQISAIPFIQTKEMCQNTKIQVPRSTDYYPSALVIKDLQDKYEFIARSKLFLN